MSISSKALTALSAAIVVTGCAAPGTPAREENIVARVARAPVSPDGDVAGRPTDLVIHLAVDPDPLAPGKSLRAGRSVRVTLPPQFTDSGEVPLLDYASDPRCGPQRLECSTAAFVQGYPQSPVPFGKYTVQRDGHTLVLTAKEDIDWQSPTAPGIKTVHLLLRGWRNPKPGNYRIDVEAQTGPNGAVERGHGQIAVQEQLSPSINLTSVFDQPGSLPKTSPPTRLSPQHQLAPANSLLPVPYNFLLWDANGGPLDGVTIEPTPAKNRFVLIRRGQSVGSVTVHAPEGAAMRLATSTPSTPIKAPITFLPTARLQAQFVTGHLPGEYVLDWSLDGGNHTQTRVRVPADH